MGVDDTGKLIDIMDAFEKKSAILSNVRCILLSEYC